MVIVLTVIAIAAILDTPVTIEKVAFGVVERFKGRTGRIVLEGFRLKLPFIERISVFSLELVKTKVSAELTTKDLLGLIVTGDLQYRADPYIPDANGLNVFVSISDEIIEQGIAEAIESVLGALGGTHEHDVFIQKRRILADLVNCVLRMEVPPHMRHELDCEICRDWTPVPEEPNFRGQSMIDTDHLIEFYERHWQEIRPLVEDGRPDSVINRQASDIERRYGIAIVYFATPKVDFSAETKKALEEEKQAEFRAQAGVIRIDLLKKFKAEGLSPKEAADQADIVLDAAVRKAVISTQGNFGLLGTLIPRLEEFLKTEKEK